MTRTSAEGGDDGSAGRGHRVNGPITPGRWMTLESAAGKSPVTHVGKLDDLLASLVAELPEVEQARCPMPSEIGRPVRDPKLADVTLRCREETSGPELAETVCAVLGDSLGRADLLRRDLLEGRVGLDRWPLRESGAPPPVA